MTARWYIVHTYSNFEKKVAEEIQKKAEQKGLGALIEQVVKTRRKTALVMIGVLGASLFYGDGMLTPAISVVSAVSGLKVASPALAAQIIPFSLVILITLFALQRFGTGAVGGALVGLGRHAREEPLQRIGHDRTSFESRGASSPRSLSFARAMRDSAVGRAIPSTSAKC